MKHTIEELKLEISQLKDRVSKLEEMNSNKLSEDYKSNKLNLSSKNYYKEKHESGIYIKNIKESKRDRFGKICSVHKDIKQELEDENIDLYEYNTMLRLAIANQDYVSVKYIMESQRLNLEQVIGILNKLEKMKYIEIIKKR